MMKVAVLSDAHANIFALDNVLEAIRLNSDVKRILFAGDALGYYPCVNEVSDLLRERVDWCIKGNHDAFVTGQLSVSEDMRRVCGLDYTLSHISAGNMEWLQGLPDSAEIELAGKVIKMFHGSPWDHLEEYVYPDCLTFDRFDNIEADFVILGHTHYPMVKQRGNKIIINPGSCGQPRDYNPMASYSIVDLDSGHVEICRISYDRQTLIRRVKELGFDESVIHIILRTQQQEEGQ